MSYANGTTHYNLPQTVGTDKRDWFDTNQAYRDVDEALWGAKESAESATSQVDAIKDRLDVVESDMSTAQSDITTLEGEMSAVQSSITNLANKVDDNYTDLSDTICAVKEPSATARYPHSVGTFFWYNDTLYVAIRDIAVGNTIVPNTNCVTRDIGTVLYHLNSDLNAEELKITATSTGSQTYGQLLTNLRTQIVNLHDNLGEDERMRIDYLQGAVTCYNQSSRWFTKDNSVSSIGFFNSFASMYWDGSAVRTAVIDLNVVGYYSSSGGNLTNQIAPSGTSLTANYRIITLD